MGVEAHVELPVDERGEVRALPLSDFSIGGVPEQVVVAAKAQLAIGIDGDAVSGVCPEDVVLYADARRTGDADRIADRLVDGVVGDAVAAAGVVCLVPGAIDGDPLIGIGVDEVVGDGGVQAVSAESDAGRVGVDRVADDRRIVLRIHARRVAIHAVGLDR